MSDASTVRSGVRVVLVTGGDDPFGGVFWRAYRENGGIPLAAVIVIERPAARSHYRLWQRPLVPLGLFGLTGCTRISCRVTGLPVTRSDRTAGLHRSREEEWPGEPSIHRVPTINDDEGVRLLERLAPDVIVSVGPPEILKDRVLDSASIAALNVHNGRIPRFRGHFGTFWEAFTGEREGYVCIHEMVAKVDAGRLVAADVVDFTELGGLLDALLEKKRRGGALLARLIDTARRENALPEFVGTGSAADEEDYFPMPTFDEIMALRWTFDG